MKQYQVVAYIRVVPEEQDPMSLEDAVAEKEQQEFMFPENIYRVEEIENEAISVTEGKKGR